MWVHPLKQSIGLYLLARVFIFVIANPWIEGNGIRRKGGSEYFNKFESVEDYYVIK